MKIKELIECLSTLNPELKVYIPIYKEMPDSLGGINTIASYNSQGELCIVLGYNLKKQDGSHLSLDKSNVPADISKLN